jgi:hypothetical protein
MNLKGQVPESWACEDCGVNTAPGCLNRRQAEQAFAIIRNGERNITQTFDKSTEVYTVKSKIWEASGMQPMGGCLCIGCLERRLGRRLTTNDFMPKDPFSKVPGTERLLARRAPRRAGS